MNKKKEDFNNNTCFIHKQKTAPYAIHNIGSGKPVKLIDFIKISENAIGKQAKMRMMPMQSGDVYKTFADVTSLKKQFNYSPETSLRVGIKEFIKWFKDYY